MIYMDTTRPLGRSMPDMVECTAHLTIAGEDVCMSVIAFGASDKAFDRMELVLDTLGYSEHEKVRV